MQNTITGTKLSFWDFQIIETSKRDAISIVRFQQQWTYSELFFARYFKSTIAGSLTDLLKSQFLSNRTFLQYWSYSSFSSSFLRSEFSCLFWVFLFTKDTWPLFSLIVTNSFRWFYYSFSFSRMATVFSLGYGKELFVDINDRIQKITS